MKIEYKQKHCNTNVSKYIYMSDSVYLPKLLGNQYTNIIEKLYVQKNNIYSYNNTITVNENNMILGICWYYDSNRNKMLSVLTWLSILTYKPAIAFKMIFTKRNKLTKNLSFNGFYILVIATEEKHRSHGIGQMMISEIESIARSKMKKNIELDVEENNKKAINFYLKNGFKVAFSHAFIQGDDKAMYIRMKKII